MKVFIRKILSKCFSVFGFSLVAEKVTYESEDYVQVLIRILDKSEVKLIIDAGASIGDTSKKFAHYFPGAVIHSFEPYKKFYEQLKTNCKQNKNIHSFNKALSNFNGQSLLSINRSEGTNSLLKSSSDYSHPYHSITRKHGEEFVLTTTLDEIYPEEYIDILKLDLQGSEYSAIQGAENLLNSGRVKSIVCEVMFQDQYDNQPTWTSLVSLITKSGFCLFNMYEVHNHLGQILQADLLFVQSEMIKETAKKRTTSFHEFSKLIKY